MSASRDSGGSARQGGTSTERSFVAEIKGRRVNEAIERGMRGRESAVFLCECGNLGCSRTIELSLTAYGELRGGFDRFLVAPGHEVAGADRIVERRDDHLVVIKRARRSVGPLDSTDPRGLPDAE